MKVSNVQFNDLIAFENQIKSKGAKYWSLSAYFPILHFPACTAKVSQQMRCFFTFATFGICHAIQIQNLK